MTKTELQSALAEATQTDKRTAGVFLDTLSALAYKEIKKNGEFVLPGFGKLVKQKRKARTGFNPKTQQKIKMAGLTWSTIKTQALISEIRFGFGLFIDGREEEGTCLVCQVISAACEEYATPSAT